MNHLLWNEGAPLAQGNGAEDCPSLTPYLVEDKGQPAAAVIICPGGGYGFRADHEGEPIARWLNTLGISAFVLNYRVYPYRHPSPLLDAQRALRTVRHYASGWNIDPERVGILGFSAGGHLASTAGTHYDAGAPEASDPVERQSCRPDLMILCYPVISFQAGIGHEGSLIALLGEEPDDSSRSLLSNEQQIDSHTPPTFLWHTAEDGLVVPENSMMFALALGKHGVPYELHIYERGHHGLGLAELDESARTWTQLCGLWLKRRGWTCE